MDSCRQSLQDVGFVEEKGGEREVRSVGDVDIEDLTGRLYCEDCYGRYLAPSCSKCRKKITGVSCISSQISVNLKLALIS